MHRREALQLLATGIALQLAPAKLFAVAREMRTLIGSETALRTLNAHQNATVIAIADLIIPRTETPGAADIGVSRFVDLILTEWYNERERDRFLHGLADVDECTRDSFGKKFIECSSVQQSEIMMGLGERMTEEANAVRFDPRYRGAQPKPNKNFYYMIRSLTLTAYYTSEQGATRDLGFEIVPARYNGCTSAQGTQQAKRHL